MDIDSIKNSLDSEIQAVDSKETLEAFRSKYLGRKGALAELTASIPTLPKEQRASFGQQVNSFKQRITSLLEEKQKSLSAPLAQELGRLHPLTQVIDEICQIFIQMGFLVVEGP